MASETTDLGDPVQGMRASAAASAPGLSRSLWNNPLLSILLLLLVLAGLPVAVWLDLSTLSEHALREQAGALSRMIDSIRNYYADNVVSRVTAMPHRTETLANYADVPGAIPIPATLSLEIGAII